MRTWIGRTADTAHLALSWLLPEPHNHPMGQDGDTKARRSNNVTLPRPPLGGVAELGSDCQSCQCPRT